MILHDRTAQLKAYFQNTWQETGFCIGAYGHETSKPTKLYSCSDNAHNLKKEVPEHLQQRLKDAQRLPIVEPETGDVTGGAGLKGSQAYPEAYGDAVGALFHSSRQSIEALSDSDSDGE